MPSIFQLIILNTVIITISIELWKCDLMSISSNIIWLFGIHIWIFDSYRLFLYKTYLNSITYYYYLIILHGSKTLHQQHKILPTSVFRIQQFHNNVWISPMRHWTCDYASSKRSFFSGNLIGSWRRKTLNRAISISQQQNYSWRSR